MRVGKNRLFLLESLSHVKLPIYSVIKEKVEMELFTYLTDTKAN